MELLDVWCGCMSWRKLAQYVKWLPTSAALYRSIRASKPRPAPPEGAVGLVVDDPIQAMQHGYLEDLVLSAVNALEARNWAESDPEKRGDYLPTLPRGYKRVAPDFREQVAAYLAGSQPATD